MKITVQSISFLLLGMIILTSCGDEKPAKTPKQVIEKIELEAEENEILKDTAKAVVEEPEVNRTQPPTLPFPDPGPEPVPPPMPPRPVPVPLPPPPVKPPFLTDPNPVFVVTEVEPAYPGGVEAMKEFIKENIIYPEIAKEAGEQGKVYVELVVEKDGSLSNVRVIRGISESLDREAKRIVRAMPNWIPGEHDGNVVRCKSRLPILFLLE